MIKTVEREAQPYWEIEIVLVEWSPEVENEDGETVVRFSKKRVKGERYRGDNSAEIQRMYESLKKDADDRANPPQPERNAYDQT